MAQETTLEPLPVLPPATLPGGRYIPVLVHDGLAYVSGHLPKVDGKIAFTGKVGGDCSIEDGRHAARVCALACLGSLAETLGSLDAVERVVKVTGFVASASTFNRQSGIVDAASDAIIQYLGVRGEHARSSVGVFQLPYDAPVEIEMICAVKVCA
jgi:enamine deaminase RidA (YjgF/YER057c/UK114 family)